ADVFGAEITTLSTSEGPALGAALLAGVGAGVYSSVLQACETTIKVASRQNPDMDINKKYMKNYRIYKSLYQSLKQDFKELSKIM
ncbi:MAG: hypothetical protein KBH82_12620, partial [Syntrophorhabdaceae bacterium]|nr:hypothetical protein [Syntrophorhabdaceae bacterium]